MNKSVKIHKAAEGAKHRIVQAAVLVPMVVDLQGDWMTKEDIASAAYDFLANYNVTTTTGKQHKELIPQKAQVVESFLVPDGQSLTLGSETYPEGTWIVSVRILDDDLWAAVESGEITGFSVGGTGSRVEAEPGSVP